MAQTNTVSVFVQMTTVTASGHTSSSSSSSSRSISSVARPSGSASACIPCVVLCCSFVACLCTCSVYCVLTVLRPSWRIRISKSNQSLSRMFDFAQIWCNLSSLSTQCTSDVQSQVVKGQGHSVKKSNYCSLLGNLGR